MTLANALTGPLSALKGLIGDDKDAMRRTQDADNARVLAEVEELYKKARDDRRQYEGEWQVNLAFLKGQQYTQWSKTRQTLWVPPAPPWRIRVTTNLIAPVVRTLLGKVLATDTQTKVLAANNTPEAAQDARAQDELLDHLKTVTRAEDANAESARWMIATGTSIHHPCWDKSLGDEVMYPDTQMVDSVDEFGMPTRIEQPHPMAGQAVREPNPDTGEDDGTGNVVHMGDIDHIVVSPFQFFPPPMAKRVEDMEWAFYVSVRSADYVQRKYGVKVEEDTIAADDFLTFNTGDDGQLGSQTKGVVVKEFWRRPCSEYPEGQYVVYTDNKVFVNSRNPYMKLPIPFIVVADRATVLGDRLWGRGILSDLVPLQRHYNKLKSQGAEIREYSARPKWHVFDTALIPGKPITTAPAEVLITKFVAGAPDGGKPSKIEGGDVPASFATEAASIERQFFEVAGLHDFRQGTQGLAGGKTFGGLRLLIEQDDTRVGLLKKEHDKGIVAVQSAELKLAKQYYIEPRAIQVVGPDNAVEVHQFYSEKIGDDPQVRLMASGALPMTYAARQDAVYQMRREGIITDPRSVRKLLGVANIPGVNDDLELDTRQAERENEQLKNGDVPAAHDYDNHLIHGHEHDNYRKGEEFEQVAANDPSIVQRFQQHVEMHKQLLASAAQGMAPMVPAPVAPAASATPAKPASKPAQPTPAL